MIYARKTAASDKKVVNLYNFLNIIHFLASHIFFPARVYGRPAENPYSAYLSKSSGLKEFNVL